MHWNAEMEMAMWWMVGWGPGGVPQLGSQLRGRHPSLGPKILPAAAVVAAAPTAAAVMFRGKRARLRVRVDGGLEVRRERQRRRTRLGGEKPEQARAGGREIRTLRPPPGQHRSRTGARGEGGSPRGRASSRSPARCFLATSLPRAPSCRLLGSSPQPLASLSPETTRCPLGQAAEPLLGAASHLAGGQAPPPCPPLTQLARGALCSKAPGSIQGC